MELGILFFTLVYIHTTHAQDGQVPALRCNVDVVIVMDKSGTINDGNWNLIKQFAGFIAESLQINIQANNGDKNRGGIVVFSELPYLQKVFCNETSTLAEFKTKAQGLPREDRKNTDIISALKAGEEILNGRGCGRNDSQKIVVLLSDGKANRPIGSTLQALFDEAMRIRQQNIVIYAVALATTNHTNLNSITGNSGNVFGTENIAGLTKLFADDLSAFLCERITTPPPITTTTTQPETTTTTTQPETTTTTTTQPETTTTTTETTTTTQPETTTTTQPETTTTTTETTTTTQPETTTTTTESTTTTTEDTTTTTETTTTTPPVDILICKCESNLKPYHCLQWTKYEIIRNFSGSCYTDKLKKAITTICKQIEEIELLVNVSITCKTSLRGIIKLNTSFTDQAFRNFEDCTIMIYCKLYTLLVELKDKKKSLELELRLELEGFGGMEVSGYSSWLWKWFPKMFKRGY